MGNKRKAKRTKKFGEPRDRPANKVCWAIARVMTKMRPPQELVNKKVYCEKCGEYYCLGADNKDEYCNVCFYKGDPSIPDEGLPIGCQKLSIGSRNCKHCGG